MKHNDLHLHDIKASENGLNVFLLIYQWSSCCGCIRSFNVRHLVAVTTPTDIDSKNVIKTSYTRFLWILFSICCIPWIKIYYAIESSQHGSHDCKIIQHHQHTSKWNFIPFVWRNVPKKEYKKRIRSTWSMEWDMQLKIGPLAMQCCTYSFDSFPVLWLSIDQPSSLACKQQRLEDSWIRWQRYCRWASIRTKRRW